VLDNKDKFVVVHASSGHKHSLDEALLDEGVRSQLLETKVARDVAVLDKFMRMLDTDADRAQYGAAHVRHACDQGAVETLLISDDM
jgi:protein pelota